MVLWNFVGLALVTVNVAGIVRGHVATSSCHVLRHVDVVARAMPCRALIETHWFATVSKRFGGLGTGARNNYVFVMRGLAPGDGLIRNITMGNWGLTSVD